MKRSIVYLAAFLLLSSAAASGEAHIGLCVDESHGTHLYGMGMSPPNRRAVQVVFAGCKGRSCVI